MRVHVRSEDPEVIDLCFDLLPHFAGRGLTITTGPVPPPGNFAADLYIWQLGPENFPDSELKVGEIEKYVFLIDREYLSRARPDVLKYPAVLLLKPVSQATLKMVIEQALERNCRDTVQKTPTGDRDELLQCLLEANLQIQEYDQDRLRFLARAIHDFRAPLTSIGGYCGLFLSGDLGPLEHNQADVMRRMQRSVERLSRLVEAMLQLSMGRLAPTAVKRQPASIHDCIQQALHELKPLAMEKRIALEVDVEPPPRGASLRGAADRAGDRKPVAQRVQVHPEIRADRDPRLSIPVGSTGQHGRGRKWDVWRGDGELLSGRYCRLRSRHPAGPGIDYVRGIRFV